MTERDLADRIRSACTDLQIAWPEMIRTIPAARRLGTIGRSGERIEPIGAHVLDERDDIPHVLTYWTRAVLDESATTDAPGGHEVPDLAAFLSRHADFLATGQHGAEQWGPVAAEELEKAAATCVGIASPSSGSDRRLVGLCPSCGRRLDATPDRTWLACDCGEVADIRHVREAGRDVIRDRLCTALEAERLGAQLGVPVRRPTVRSWVARGQLLPVACTVSDRANVFRWGDLERLVADMATRTGRAHAS